MSVIRVPEQASAGSNRSGVDGFTLVEILIVISIISILASMVLVGVQRAREGANMALAKTSVADLTNALERYMQDEGEYPGQNLDPDADRNDFPLLFIALFGEKRPKGGGGRSAPYTNPSEDDIVVFDDSLGDYRNPERSERFDEDIEKFLCDPWGQPYIYRCNKGHSRAEYEFMVNPAVDIYSIGSDGIDQTKLGERVDEAGEKADDVGNW